MKKIIFSIIMVFIIFSSNNQVFAKQGQIEKSLNLKYGPEILKLNKFKLKTFNFKNKDFNKVFSNFSKLNKSLSKAIIKKYEKNDISYDNMNNIAKNYRYFIFHTNKFFSLIKEREKSRNYDDIILYDNIIKNYELSRQYFNSIKFYIKKEI